LLDIEEKKKQMFDIQVRKQIDPWLDKIAGVLARLGVRPNAITWFGLCVGLGASLSIALGGFTIGFVLIAINRLCDGLDGCVARHTGKTDLGGFLDIALDMIFYASIPFGFALVNQSNALPAAYLLFSFFGSGTSFLAFAIITSKRGVVADNAGKKSFFYSTGLIEGTETAVFLLLICLIPSHFATCAWIFGTLCWFTTAIRIRIATVEFSEV